MVDLHVWSYAEWVSHVRSYQGVCDLPIGSVYVGYVMICFGICGAISSYASGWLNKHVGRITLLCTGVCDLPLGVYMVGYVMICFGICGAIIPMPAAWLNKHVGRITLLCTVRDSEIHESEIERQQPHDSIKRPDQIATATDPDNVSVYSLEHSCGDYFLRQERRSVCFAADASKDLAQP
ncbi:hypothetical protein ScPMuIL_000372 [Solemya velum]